MKAATIILALAGAVMAQNFEGQPSCATSCLSSAINAVGCKSDDIACQCGPTKASIAATVVGCLFSACPNPTDIAQAQKAGDAQCSEYSATATPTDDSSSSVTSAPSSTSGGSDSSSASAPITSGPSASGQGASSSSSSGIAAAATPIALGAGAMAAAFFGAVAAM